MAIRKYRAENRIVGLQPNRRGADGIIREHVVQLGETIDLDERKAAEFVAGGSLKLVGAMEQARAAMSGAVTTARRIRYSVTGPSAAEIAELGDEAR